MIVRLEGKVAIITGAANGLGKAIALGYAREGAKLVLTDINIESLGKVAEEVKEIGAQAISFELNVICEERWKEVVKETLDHFGQLNIVVNNAGIGTHGNIETTTFEEWKKLLDINLNGVFLGTKYGAEAMLANGSKGSIINMSSIAGLVGDSELLAYSASKGAVRLFSKSAALHLAKKGIRVNTIHPGYMNTDLIQLVPDPSAMIAAMPLGYLGDPAMIAQGAIYLGSDESAFSTGSELVIDGGYTAV
jgi:NAD(P)-dependent dehydrogenase (short-subunit alcohol dehydrogenase family)